MVKAKKDENTTKEIYEGIRNKLFMLTKEVEEPNLTVIEAYNAHVSVLEDELSASNEIVVDVEQEDEEPSPQLLVTEMRDSKPTRLSI